MDVINLLNWIELFVTDFPGLWVGSKGSIIENGYWVAQRKGVYMGRTEKRIKVKLLWEDKIKYFSPK